MWYQPLNGNTQLGPAAVLSQQKQSDWLPSHEDIKKVTACRVKSFKLDDRDMVKNEEANVKKKLMLEDGLEDLENLLSDLDKDAIGAKYLRMSNSVSFDKMCSDVIELPIMNIGSLR